MISSTTRIEEKSMNRCWEKKERDFSLLVIPSDMISCILHDAEIIRVASRSMTRTFQSPRSFCRTDSHRNISAINSKRRSLENPDDFDFFQFTVLVPTNFCRLDAVVISCCWLRENCTKKFIHRRKKRLLQRKKKKENWTSDRSIWKEENNRVTSICYDSY